MAQGSANLTNNAEILKDIWEDEIQDFLYEDSPYSAMVPKDTSWSGLHQIITVQYGGTGGRSAKFDKAKQNKSPPKYKQMQIPTRDNFALWSVDHKLIVLSRDQKGALVKALGESTEKAMTKYKKSRNFILWGNGGGAVAKIAAINGTEVELDDVNDIRNFDLDDICQFADDDGSADSPAGAFEGTAQVMELDEDSGVITFDIDISTLGAGVGDFIFHDGDYAAVAHGVPAYVTVATPGTNGVPAAIHGMDRTDFPTRLAGSRFTGSQNQTQEEIVNALTKAFRRNCRVTHLFTEPEVFAEIALTLEGNRRYADEKIGRVGFTGIEFISQSGKVVKIFGDPNVRKLPNGNTPVWGLALDTWKYHSAQEDPMWLTEDGTQRMTVEANANAKEGRIGGYAEHYTRSPKDNFLLELEAA